MICIGKLSFFLSYIAELILKSVDSGPDSLVMDLNIARGKTDPSTRVKNDLYV